MRGIVRALYGGVAAPTRGGQNLFAPGREVPSSMLSRKGEVMLLVNTASKCGFASQYDALEELYQRYRERGFVVIGFPSNDFMGQEPKGDAEIQSSCRINHGVTFPLMPKGVVRGKERQPVFAFLTEEGPAELRGPVRWNFEKFLLDREGFLVGRWRSYVTPESASIRRGIESLL